jgi:hypothetical protein
VIVQVAHFSHVSPFDGVAVCGAQERGESVRTAIHPARLRPAELERVAHDVSTCSECVRHWYELQRD